MKLRSVQLNIIVMQLLLFISIQIDSTYFGAKKMKYVRGGCDAHEQVTRDRTIIVRRDMNVCVCVCVVIVYKKLRTV